VVIPRGYVVPAANGARAGDAASPPAGIPTEGPAGAASEDDAPDGIEAAARIATAWRLLAGVMDPEIPVLSLLDLGVIRAVREWPAAHPGERAVLEVTLTPTYSGCPATEVIESDVRGTLEAAGLGPVRLQRRLAPAWSTDWISEAGRQRLREYGIAPPGPAGALTPAGDMGPTGATGVPQATPGGIRAVLHFLPREAARPACPRCDSADTERLSPFGATACKALYRCRACREPFELFKPL
jgi:ring-1,2-phenylacetyl-CoA epoxidase subunit PaaD